MQKVLEKDVVLVIHEHGKLTLKELVGKFKALLTEKAEKAEFMAIVKKVAKLTNADGEKFVSLNDSTLDEYKLAT